MWHACTVALFHCVPAAVQVVSQVEGLNPLTRKTGQVRCQTCCDMMVHDLLHMLPQVSCESHLARSCARL